METHDNGLGLAETGVLVKREPSDEAGWMERLKSDVQCEHEIALKMEPLEQNESPEQADWMVAKSKDDLEDTDAYPQYYNSKNAELHEDNESIQCSSPSLPICSGDSTDTMFLEINYDKSFEEPKCKFIFKPSNQEGVTKSNGTVKDNGSVHSNILSNAVTKDDCKEDVTRLLYHKEQNRYKRRVCTKITSEFQKRSGMSPESSGMNERPQPNSSKPADRSRSEERLERHIKLVDNSGNAASSEAPLNTPEESLTPVTNSIKSSQEESHYAIAGIDGMQLHKTSVTSGLVTCTEMFTSKAVSPVNGEELQTFKVRLGDDNEEVIQVSETSRPTRVPNSRARATHKCAFCERVYTTNSNLKRHLKSHSGEKPYQCKFCEKSFSTTDKLKNHERIHSGDKPHCCLFCGKEFIFSHKLKNHERLHTGERPYICDFCGEAFSTRDKWRQHSRKHTPEGIYICKFCDKAFNSKLALMYHERTHTGFVPYQCEYCNVTFTSSSNLNRHIRNHTGERPYQCHYCDKTFAIRNYLTNHERIHGQRPYKCSFCKKGFVSSSALSVHVRMHTGERPYKCQFCEKTFVRRDAMTHHERTHTGVRPYQCKLCDKAYTTSPHLRIHERTHSSERPYKCNYCEKGFTTSDKCRIHERIHTGEKPYPCKKCEERFSTSTKLRKHEKSVHTDLEEPADHCENNDQVIIVQEDLLSNVNPADIT